MKRELLEAVLAARRERQAVALVTDLASAKPAPGGPRRGRSATRSQPSWTRRFASISPATHDGQFVNIHNPPLRLVIIGAVHIAQAVIPMAQQLGL